MQGGKDMQKKNESGVTLLALVVTITVLIILTGVTINLGFVQNGGLVKTIRNETEMQRNMVTEEKNKANKVLSNQEKEWGID